MPGLGERLKAIREEKDLSPEDAGEELNIKTEDLLAIEGENFRFFPDRQFALTVLEIYAAFLGINKEEVDREFSAIWPEYGPLMGLFKKRGNKRAKEILATETVREVFPVKAAAAKEEPNSRKGLSIAAVAVVFVIAIGVFAFWQFQGWSEPGQRATSIKDGQTEVSNGQEKVQVEDSRPDSFEADKVESISALRPEAITTQVVEEQSITVEITTPKGQCWIEVVADGREVCYRLVPSDTPTIVFKADREISVLIGDAASTRIKMNGQDLGPLGERSVVVQRVFTTRK